MTLPQTQNYLPGTVMDRSRSQFRTRCYPSRTTRWTAVVGGTATTGTYSYAINGVVITYAADTGAGDDNASIAAGLLADYNSKTAATRIAVATLLTLTLTINERIPGAGFTLTGAVAPGAGTLVLTDLTPASGELRLGIAVAIIDGEADNIRTLTTGDTAANVFGVTVESSGLKPATGNPQDVDVYEEGAAALTICKGPVPVEVEVDVKPGDPVFVRVTATGSEVAGAFRIEADGGDAVQIAARWLSANYSSRDGRNVAELDINVP
jgi:hypothetical protein